MQFPVIGGIRASGKMGSGSILYPFAAVRSRRRLINKRVRVVEVFPYIRYPVIVVILIFIVA